MDLTQGNIKKQLISMAVPAGIGMLFYTLYNVVDTFYAGLTISLVYLLSPSLGDAFFGLYFLAEAKGLFLYINFKEVKLPLSLERPIVKLLLIL